MRIVDRNERDAALKIVGKCRRYHVSKLVDWIKSYDKILELLLNIRKIKMTIAVKSMQARLWITFQFPFSAKTFMQFGHKSTAEQHLVYQQQTRASHLANVNQSDNSFGRKITGVDVKNVRRCCFRKLHDRFHQVMSRPSQFFSD